MVYRRRLKGSSKFNERLSRARASRERKRLDVPAPDYPPILPALRRRIIIEDYDLGETVRHEISLYRTNRVDCYRVEVDGSTVASRMGWARVLELARKAFVRLHS